MLVQGEIIPRLLKSRPAINRISDEVDSGSSGGTGSLGSLLYASATAEQLRFRLGVLVDTQLHITGGVTSCDLGRNTRFNAVANIIDTAERMLASSASLKEAWSVIFREIPAVGIDRHERNLHVLMAEQALSGHHVEQALMFVAPNQAGRDRFGNMSTLQFGFGKPLDPHDDVAPDNAKNLGVELAHVLATPAQPVVKQLETPTEEMPLAQEPVEHLVERAWESDPDEWLEAATQVGLAASAMVMVLLATGVTLNLLETRRQCAVPPTTGKEAAQRLGWLRSCLLDAKQHLDRAIVNVLECQAAVDRAWARVESSIRLVHPRTLWQWICALLTTLAYKERRLVRTTTAFRQVDDERVIAEAQLAALQEAVAQLHAEHDFLEQRLEEIEDALSRFQYQGDAARSVPLVTTLPLDEVFTELWELRPSDSDKRILKTVCGATHQVTLDGLARIVGASEARHDLIAKHIASRQFVKLGPAWGSFPRGLEAACIHVLPPIDPHTADKLRELISALDKSTVCVADTAEAAVNFVDLYLEPVRTMEDLLPGYYASALVELVNSPNWPLFFPKGLDVLKRLGIEVKDDGIHFHPLD